MARKHVEWTPINGEGWGVVFVYLLNSTLTPLLMLMTLPRVARTAPPDSVQLWPPRNSPGRQIPVADADCMMAKRAARCASCF
jgi:hypothetical protein